MLGEFYILRNSDRTWWCKETEGHSFNHYSHNATKIERYSEALAVKRELRELYPEDSYTVLSIAYN